MWGEAMEVPEMVLVTVSVPIQVERMLLNLDTRKRELACQGKTNQCIRRSRRSTSPFIAQGPIVTTFSVGRALAAASLLAAHRTSLTTSAIVLLSLEPETLTTIGLVALETPYLREPILLYQHSESRGRFRPRQSRSEEWSCPTTRDPRTVPTFSKPAVCSPSGTAAW